MTRRLIAFFVPAALAAQCKLAKDGVLTCPEQVKVMNETHPTLEIIDNAFAILHLRRSTDEELTDHLLALSGVEGIQNIRRYSVQVEKGKAYTWEELTPIILKVAQQHDQRGAKK